MPCTILIQTGETGKPHVIAVIYPSISLGQFTVNSESRHCKNPERHLPDVILGDMIFQIIIIMVIHLVSILPDASKQVFSGIFIQKVIESIISQCAK